MAIAIEMDYRDATMEQYDGIRERMGLTPGGPAPAGAISHFVAATDEGMHVVDVWESREAFDQFVRDQIGPYSAEVGITTEPTLRFFEVHNYLTPGTWSGQEAAGDMTRAQLTALDDAGMRAWDTHDADALLALFADGFVWNDVAAPEPITTASGLRDYMDTWFTAFPDMRARTVNRVVGDGSVAAELEFTGTHTGPLRMGDTELPATGVSVVGRGTYFLRARGGKVVEFNSDPDLVGLLVQLGMMTAPTAGHTTER